jgi:hypothetical protein
MAARDGSAVAMDISNLQVQTQNPSYSTSVDPEAGPSILVTGKPNNPTISVMKANSVVDDVIDAAGEAILDLTPSLHGIERFIDAVEKVSKKIGNIAQSVETITFDIPLEVAQNHKCTVSFSTIVKALTQDTGNNEYATATFKLIWNGGPTEFWQAENSGLGTLKFIPVSLVLRDMVGHGTDHVTLEITRSVSTDGAILQSPCTSELTIQQLTFLLEEA